MENFKPETFHFRGLHPNVCIGTASDRYAGWIGQIYTRERYKDRISRRDNKVGGKTFVEEVLPVESVKEYFEHFSVLEVDYTFYRLLLEKDGQPTQNYHVLRKYHQYMKKGDLLLLKVPQIISAQKIRRAGQFAENEAYLNPEIFINQFYKQAVEILGSALAGLIFEQEYQRKQDRTPVKEMAKQLDAFFGAISKDERYHIEVRTESYLTNSVFEVLAKHGVGQVLSHWTWLPRLLKQFAKADTRFFNSEKACVIRLMTPIGMRYEDAYTMAHPFDKMVDGMMSPEMVEETASLMQAGIERGMRMYVIINTRAGGNAPLIARRVAERFLEI